MDMMWREETLAFDHSVMAVARTEWLVYVWDSQAPREISFIIVASVITPSCSRTRSYPILGLSATVVGKKLAVPG